MAASADLRDSPGAPRPAAARKPRSSRWPARLDLIQSSTGLVLALFLSVHLLLDSAILVGPHAADFVARAFEGAFIFARPQPWIISVVAVILLILVVVHAVLAMRKLPGNYAQYRALAQQTALIRHSDTTLWRWQAITGFALFFLVAPHLLLVMLQPADIGAEASARRIVGDLAVFYYLVFLPVVIVHAAFGTYRVLLKWGHPPIATAAGRARARRITWIVGLAYLALGLASLAAYVRFGLALPT
jgi:fumarate reductase subunit C